MSSFLDRNAESILVGIVSSIVLLLLLSSLKWLIRYSASRGRKEGERIRRWRELLRSDASPDHRSELMHYFQLEIATDQSAASNALFMFIYCGMFSLFGGVLGLAMDQPSIALLSMAGLIVGVASMMLFRERMIIEANTKRVILEELRQALAKAYRAEIPGKAVRV